MNGKQHMFLGIEFGSTRIKAVLTGEGFAPLSSGSHTWENRYENGYWTYRLEDVWTGLRESYGALAAEYRAKFGQELTAVSAIGISAMMHGYLVFDAAGTLLTPFRTWRNTTTEQAADILTERFGVKIPQRWSIAHLYQAILNKEPHVKDIARMTTLAGYVHAMLTGKNVLGVGEASGMFPVGDGICDYDGALLESFGTLIRDADCPWTLRDILPKVLNAGEEAGRLTGEGAALLDTSRKLQAGIPFCPPEGDAGTGMVATNSVAALTGNISAGTSIFTMAVLEKPLTRVYPEIDTVVTPAGKPVAMVHGNNCTPDIDAWVRFLGESLGRFGLNIEKPALYDALYECALEAEADGGGLTAYNFFSSEDTIGLKQGRPMLIRQPDSRFTLPNLMRTLIFSSVGVLKIGMDILTGCEAVRLTQMQGHGGLFKTPVVGQRLLASALDVPVAVAETAGEGGAWGIALLAAYTCLRTEGETLEDFLSMRVFVSGSETVIAPDPADVKGFAAFLRRYKEGLAAQKAAGDIQ